VPPRLKAGTRYTYEHRAVSRKIWEFKPLAICASDNAPADLADLAEAISISTFPVPVVTPLFFKSDPCRDELKQFIDHEKSLGRTSSKCAVASIVW
jgi:hypothetical protein